MPRSSFIREGEIGDGEIGEGGCEETFHCLSLTYKHERSQCSTELNKQWYTLADFLPTWDISQVLLHIICRKKQRSCAGQRQESGDIIRKI